MRVNLSKIQVSFLLKQAVRPAPAEIQGQGKNEFLCRFAALTFGPLKTPRE